MTLRGYGAKLMLAGPGLQVLSPRITPAWSRCLLKHCQGVWVAQSPSPLPLLVLELSLPPSLCLINKVSLKKKTHKTLSGGCFTVTILGTL